LRSKLRRHVSPDSSTPHPTGPIKLLTDADCRENHFMKRSPTIDATPVVSQVSALLFAAAAVFLTVSNDATADSENALDTANVVRIEVSPPTLHLSGPRSPVQLLITGIDRDGHQIDLTRVATFSRSEFVKVEQGGGYVRPVQDGKGSIEISVTGHQITLPIHVEHTVVPQPVSFRWETLAVLTKQGCNSGSCHGKPNGRGALELSLNAFDPALDQRSLIRGAFVRFTEPLVPDESLMLKKPTLRIPHGGGKRLRPEDDQYAILRQWIYDGCQPDPEDAPVCVGITVEPDEGRVIDLDRSGRQQIRVDAEFSDGATRDVTRIATWTVSHEAVASVDANGLVTGLDRGQAAISVRYLDALVSVPVTVLKKVSGFKWTDPAEANIVDTLVHNKLRQLQYLPSDICDDSTFIRRLSLDVRGLLPTVEETKAFLADTASDKRARIIDRFLDSLEYAAYWSLKIADILRINREKLSPEKATAFSEWIRTTVEKNVPYDRFVNELLTAKGLTSKNQSANFFRVTADTNMVSETVAQLFMGSRIMCAQCHNHPYEKWTQDNYYQVAAAFHEIDRVQVEADSTPDSKGRKKRKPGPTELDIRIELTHGRAMSNPRTGVVQKPWPTDVARAVNEDRRVAFAAWLTAAGNPYFARVAVNRMWAHLLGRGLVEPVDDFRSSNPAVNNEVLDALADEFEKSDFDRKHVLRLILNSHTWQRSSETNSFNKTDETLFSHARIRMLSAEQIQDAITRLCDGPERPAELTAEIADLAGQIQELTGEPPATSGEPDRNRKDAATKAAATQEELDALLDGKSKSKSKDVTKKVAEIGKRLDSLRKQRDEYFMTQQPYPHLTPFLRAFGQPERETACACERREEVSLDQALQFMNSPLIRSRVSHAARRLSELKNEQLIQELYLTAFCRTPTESEHRTVEQYIQSATDRRQPIEDIIWSLINTNEFMFQH
jgi:hypothetical protein